MLSARTSTLKPPTHRPRRKHCRTVACCCLLAASVCICVELISYARIDTLIHNTKKRVFIAVRVILHLSLSIHARGVYSVDGGLHQNLISFIKKRANERQHTRLVTKTYWAGLFFSLLLRYGSAVA